MHEQLKKIIDTVYCTFWLLGMKENRNVINSHVSSLSILMQSSNLGGSLKLDACKIVHRRIK
jgi:hypothetical protein